MHGNVCLESVVVTQTLDWKLHAFDVLSEFDGSNEASTGPMLVIHVFIGISLFYVYIGSNFFLSNDVYYMMLIYEFQA